MFKVHLIIEAELKLFCGWQHITPQILGLIALGPWWPLKIYNLFN